MPEAPIAGVSSPRKRGAFLTAEWRYLVMLNYEIEPRVLEPLVPSGTVLDLWRGRALVSVVGFRFLDTRLLGVSVPFHRDFDEVNLRFYVRHVLSNGEVRRGVVFVREFVPRAAVALSARAAYNEPYIAVPMRSSVPDILTEAPGPLTYEWQVATKWQRLGATPVGAPTVAPPESEAAFIAEHYWGYTRQRDGSTVEYEVAHPAWRVWAATEPDLRSNIVDVYGAPFVHALSRPTTSAFVAEGSTVIVYPPRRL